MQQRKKPDWESESYTVPTDGIVDTLDAIRQAGGRVIRSAPVGAGFFLTVMWKA